MAKRVCDECGKNRDMQGGKTCETGHFICRYCMDLGFLAGKRHKCPLCSKSLR